MIRYFRENQEVSGENEPAFNWLLVTDPDEAESRHLAEKYDLPPAFVTVSRRPEEISCIKTFSSRCLASVTAMSLLDLQPLVLEQSFLEANRVEKRLLPLRLIITAELLLIVTAEPAVLLADLRILQPPSLNSTRLAAHVLLGVYRRFNQELAAVKEKIDALDQAARQTTENQELFKLADLERDLVYLQDTLRDQSETMNVLLEQPQFIEHVANRDLLFQIEAGYRQAMKTCDLYRDLLQAIGGLFSDMMDNHLNHLMKYLDSATLLISIPALIAGIWGMNSGGLPGKEGSSGFWLVLILAGVLTGLAAWHLYRKDYS